TAVGAEDYRWAYVQMSFDCMLGARGVVQVVAWEVFNFTFILLFQLGLLYQISVLVCQVITTAAKNNMWSVSKVALFVLTSLLLVAETMADQQQYKLRRLRRPKVLKSEPDQDYAQRRKAEVEAGFVYSGLWRFLRHPNVFCEQAFWAVMAVFAATATKSISDYCVFVTGPALLIALMWVSVGLTESITLGKYPMYRAYQLKT
ncbi:hypothetical protein GGI21_003909, partial [Coemansia aciculifera]